MSWISKLRNALFARRLDDDLAAEYEDHLERRTAEWEAKGLSPADARIRALAAFGPTLAFREQSRDLRVNVFLESFLQDTFQTARTLVRQPLFSLTIVLSLGLAIGAITAIYSIMNAAMFRALPVAHPESLVTLDTPSPDLSTPGSAEGNAFSYPLFSELRQAAGARARLMLFDAPTRTDVQFGDTNAPREFASVQNVTENMFETLGIGAARGQVLSSGQENLASPQYVCVLSHDLWLRRFGADPAIVGRPVIIDERPFTVLGVAASGFTGVETGRFVDIWLPITTASRGMLTNHGARVFHLLARLAAGVSPASLQDSLQPAFLREQTERLAAGSALPPGLAERIRQTRLAVNPAPGGFSVFRHQYARPLAVLLAVALCVLLIACINVAGLLSSRYAARSGEIALRLSLGASRTRLTRRLLTEACLPVTIAIVFGAAFARFAAPFLLALASTHGRPLQLDLSHDTPILAACAAIAGVVALLCALLPALHSARTGPVLALRRAGGQTGTRLGRLFLGAQVAFAFAVLVCGTGFLTSFRNLTSVDLGFDPRGVTVIGMVNNGFHGTPTRDIQMALANQVRDRVAASAGVSNAALAWWAAFSDARRAQRIALPGRHVGETEETFYRVSEGFFETLHIPLLDGRALAIHDTDDEPVPSVVNRAFAHKYFGGTHVVGREFLRDDGVRHLIVGLAADAHFSDTHGGPEPIVYMPMKPPRTFTLYVRSNLDAVSAGQLVAREAAALGSGLHATDVVPLDLLVDRTMVREKLLAVVGVAFAAMGLVVTMVGIFGLLSYSVSQRRKEIGLRAALGATRGRLCWFASREVSTPVSAGLLLGLAGALAALRYARSLLVGVGSHDPTVIAAGLAAFLTGALLAGLLPVWHAATVDPAETLRQD
ncbi:ADOP family duplicated permease [uncultured Paludibaculum sp.]|uniref:ADOP family duplicated permease n=1 Tax=uncultured Paludibaculum sp. TaxID=1765020 RepID=UPI002AAC3101|nr:ADOP family duplicated permease [uncultured Paludibaculum sp.]